MKLKGNSFIHDPTIGLIEEFIKALDDAHKGIVEYAEQVGWALTHHQISSKEGSTLDPRTHNHKLLEAKAYYDSLLALQNRGIRDIFGNEEQLACFMYGEPLLVACVLAGCRQLYGVWQGLYNSVVQGCALVCASHFMK